MNIASYFTPINAIAVDFPDCARIRLGQAIDVYLEGEPFPDLENIDIVIIGVEEDRFSVGNEGTASAPDAIRKAFYKLFPPHHTTIRMADLGNIKQGYEVPDTYFALSSVVEELLTNNIIPIILGGSQDITFANYQAYENLGKIINIVSVDPTFDFGENVNELTSNSFLSSIVMHQPNFLFNYTNLAFQSFHVDTHVVNLMQQLNFDYYRLGNVQQFLPEMEPIVRNADMLSVDISSVRMADAPGNANANVHGLYGEELCSIVHFAGLSDKLSSIGFYEYNPILDPRGQTAQLISQAVWYFVEGFYLRMGEFPFQQEDDYIRFLVQMGEGVEDITFYKSKKSERWWMEVNCATDKKEKYQRHYIIPCSYADYKTASENEIPDRWWQTYQKLM